MAGGVIMSKNQKNYKIILKAHAPVHIGSGKDISKKEYILTKDKQAKIIDLGKLLQLIAERDLFDSYQSYMCNNNDIALDEWLRQNRISQDEIESLVDYTLDCRGSAISRRSNIKTFMKDAYGNPYVPGSSMKGCLRTILMGCYAENKSGKYTEIKNSIRSSPLTGRTANDILKDEGNELEYTTYYTANRKNDSPAEDRKNAVNDIMAGIIIGDSKPIKKDRLILCQKCDKRARYRLNSRVSNQHDDRYALMSIFNECLAPETKIVLPLTINTALCNITVDEIKKAVTQFAESYHQNFMSKFDLPHYRYTNTLWLGGNVGFPNKTVVYNLFGQQEGAVQASRILTALGHRNRNDATVYDVSPHTINMARYKGTEYHMGECTITIKEV